MKQNLLVGQYIDLLRAYNEKINLFSRHSYDTLDFHVQDSINLANIISNKGYRVMDMGSGSGLPSVILAIMNPQNRITAVESKSKKCVFLKEAAKVLGLGNYSVQEMDIREYVAHLKESPRIVTAKAFASYSDILKMIKPLIGRRIRLVVPISKSQYEALLATTQATFNLGYQSQGFYYVDQEF